MSANSTPSAVLPRAMAGSTLSIAWPPSSTWSAGLCAALAVSISRPISAEERSCACVSQVTVAKAVVLDLFICALPAALKGLATVVTPGSFATLASIVFASAATAGESSVPCLACSTI